ncbi:LysR family transcriptional regulator [Streptomyces sp. NPDC046977]|uniref:LysR family transcriptional regulator n=1 Tax=Streptomyces sp. NPDC046977 TaxID=3154703 RepID=UPI0033C75B47
MDLALLRTFVTVHRAGSFTRAAQLLGLSQPAVTSQIRSLERQVGRPLFLRLPRGVSPTPVGNDLAHKVAPHLDALMEITQGDLAEESGNRTVHLAGPPTFTSLRVLPALAPLVAEGLQLRIALAGEDEGLAGLAAGHHDVSLGTLRPRDRLLAATPLWDEEQILVAAPVWQERIGGPQAVHTHGPRVLDDVPVISYDEGMPLLDHYWSAVFDSSPAIVPAVVVPDLRAVLECVTAGVGMAVLPRYLCGEALAEGSVAALLEPPVPPLRTYFVSVRAGTIALPHIARVHEQLVRAAAGW